jgi:hypothetical protein
VRACLIALATFRLSEELPMNARRFTLITSLDDFDVSHYILRVRRIANVALVNSESRSRNRPLEARGRGSGRIVSNLETIQEPRSRRSERDQYSEALCFLQADFWPRIASEFAFNRTKPAARRESVNSCRLVATFQVGVSIRRMSTYCNLPASSSSTHRISLSSP